MKKIIALIIALTMAAVVFAGCKDTTPPEKDVFVPATAYDLVSNALEQTRGLSSVDVVMVGESTTVMVGQISKQESSLSLKGSDMHGDNKEIYVYSMSITDGEASIVEFYKDVTDCYIKANMQGMIETYRMKNYEVGSLYDSEEDIKSYIVDAPKDILEAAEIIDNGDGTKTVTVTIPEDRTAEVFTDITERVKYLTAELGATILSVGYGDAVVSYTVNDGGYIVNYSISYTSTTRYKGGISDIAVSEKRDITFNSPGEAVEVTPLDGYESYPLFSDIEGYVNNAIYATYALESHDMEYVTEASVSSDLLAKSYSWVAKTVAKGNKVYSYNPEYYYERTTPTAMFGEQKVTGYCADGWAYIVTDYGIGNVDSEKFTSDSARDLDYHPFDEPFCFTVQLPAEILLRAEVEDNKDGTYDVTLDLTEEEFFDYYYYAADYYVFTKDVVQHIGAVKSRQLDSVSSAKVCMTIGHGYLVEFRLSYSLTLALSGNYQSGDTATANYDVEHIIVFNNLGESVTVPVLEGYEEIQ